MEKVYLEATYKQFMSNNVRLWMGAFKGMGDTERGYSMSISTAQDVCEPVLTNPTGCYKLD